MTLCDRRPSRLTAGSLALATVLALAGCADPWQPGAGVIDVPFQDRAQAPKTQAYCYRTLAEVDCYRVPLPAADGRRVGWTDAREFPDD